MKAIKIITALLLTAALVGCNGEDTDIDSSETFQLTETVGTELTDSIAVMETQTPSNEPAAAPEDTGELLDTLDIRGYSVVFYYDKTPGELAEFHAVSYGLSDCDREEPLCTVSFRTDNEPGYTQPVPGGYYLKSLNYQFFTFSPLPAGDESAVMLFDMGEGGMLSLYSYEGDYEIPAENLGVNEEKYRLYDYGARRYTEYSIDPVNKTVTKEGELEYRSDIDMTYLAMRVECVKKTFTGEMTQCIYGDRLTEAGSGDNVSYYRVSPDFAGSIDDLREMIDTVFTEELAEKCFTQDPFTPPDDDTPAMFTEDGEGVIYAEIYSGGIEGRYDYDTVRLVTENNDPDTAVVTVMDKSPYFNSLVIMHFDMTGDKYKLKDIRYIGAGTYFLNE